MLVFVEGIDVIAAQAVGTRQSQKWLLAKSVQLSVLSASPNDAVPVLEQYGDILGRQGV